jgi:hypothetical protein
VKPVYIEWMDPYGHDRAGWTTVDEVLKNKGENCKTLGFIMKEDKQFLTIASTYCVDPEYTSVLNYFTIPKSVIVKRKSITL